MQSDINRTRELLSVANNYVLREARGPHQRYTAAQIKHAKGEVAHNTRAANAMNPHDALIAVEQLVYAYIYYGWPWIYVEPHANILNMCINRLRTHEQRTRHTKPRTPPERSPATARRPGKEPAATNVCKWCQRGLCFLQGFEGPDEENGGVHHLSRCM